MVKMVCEFGLPALAIERIQYFLSSKEAARTTLLSKAWRSAWLTRPNLDFDCSERSSWSWSCWDLIQKTMKRYEKSNLKIDSFRICMESGSDRVIGFTTRALKIGATHITLLFWRADFVLGKDLFGSENIVSLTLRGGEISRRITSRNVRCSRLLSLCLDSVKIKRPVMISHIISSCPLIRKLSLSNICGGDAVGMGNAMSLTNPHRLRSLLLESVYFDTLFLRALSSNFPCLKYLTLVRPIVYDKLGQEEMLISSHSLERLHFETSNDTRRLKFDVPSIRLFTFEGPAVPSLSFSSTSSGGWKSRVSIKGRMVPSTSWFRILSKFLTSLKRSRISLSLHLDSRVSFHYKVGAIHGLPTCVIEDLTLNLEYLPSLTWYALLDGLFLICRPKLITPVNNIDFIGNTLLHGLHAKFPTPNQFMYGLKDLEEARAQIFDEAVSTWRDAPLDALLDDLKIARGKQAIRFQLTWKP